MLKSWGWGGVGGPCDYCVSASPFDLDFGTLDLGLTIFLFHQVKLSVVLSKARWLMSLRGRQK